MGLIGLYLGRLAVHYGIKILQAPAEAVNTAVEDSVRNSLKLAYVGYGYSLGFPLYIVDSLLHVASGHIDTLRSTSDRNKGFLSVGLVTNYIVQGERIHGDLEIPFRWFTDTRTDFGTLDIPSGSVHDVRQSGTINIPSAP